MNARAVTFSICVLVGLIFAVHAYTYTISVTTGSGFRPSTGKLFVILRSSNQVNNVSMSSTPFSILPNHQYASIINSPIMATQLSSALFEWTNSTSRIGSITLQNVTVVPTYLQEPFRSQ